LGIKSEKGALKGRRLQWRAGREKSLRGWKAQESRKPPTRGKHLGGKIGGRLTGWEQAAEATVQGRDGFVGNRKSGEGKGNLSTIIR